jgi:hypothetical protein
MKLLQPGMGTGVLVTQPLARKILFNVLEMGIPQPLGGLVRVAVKQRLGGLIPCVVMTLPSSLPAGFAAGFGGRESQHGFANHMGTRGQTVCLAAIGVERRHQRRRHQDLDADWFMHLLHLEHLQSCREFKRSEIGSRSLGGTGVMVFSTDPSNACGVRDVIFRTPRQ